MKTGNLFANVPENAPAEIFETLLRTPHFELERIVSAGQATPPGEWLDSERDEWVLLLSGGAGLRFEGDKEVREMRPGDYVWIPARRRHRVEWTEAGPKTLWLALHYRTSPGPR